MCDQYVIIIFCTILTIPLPNSLRTLPDAIDTRSGTKGSCCTTSPDQQRRASSSVNSPRCGVNDVSSPSNPPEPYITRDPRFQKIASRSNSTGLFESHLIHTPDLLCFPIFVSCAPLCFVHCRKPVVLPPLPDIPRLLVPALRIDFFWIYSD